MNAPSLADQLEAKGLTWKAYLEGMPSPCFQGATSGSYAKKHNPFLYYDDVSGNQARCRRSIVPLASLSGDLAGGTLPDFSFIVPDQCHDMHSCAVADGDSWLASFLPGLLNSPPFQAGGVLFITFDEGSSDNHVATLVIGPRIQAGARFNVAYDHYSLVRTIEDVFGLGYLQHASDPGKTSLADVLPQ